MWCHHGISARATPATPQCVPSHPLTILPIYRPSPKAHFHPHSNLADIGKLTARLPGKAPQPHGLPPPGWVTKLLPLWLTDHHLDMTHLLTLLTFSSHSPSSLSCIARASLFLLFIFHCRISIVKPSLIVDSTKEEELKTWKATKASCFAVVTWSPNTSTSHFDLNLTH